VGGCGVAQDFTEAFKWFRLAADQGNVDGQAWIGVMYYHGESVAVDDSEAMKWFKKAADQGDEDAHRLMEKLESEMSAKAQTEKPQCVTNQKCFLWTDAERFLTLVKMIVVAGPESTQSINFSKKQVPTAWR